LALAVVALLVVTDWSLITHAAANGTRSIIVMVLGTLALLFRVPPLLGVLAAIAVGIQW
jgi:hypothetical protein